MPLVITSHPELVWLVPFLFYTIDNIARVRSDELVLCETATLSWSFRLSYAPITLAGKQAYLLQLFAPYAFAFKLQWMNLNEESATHISEGRACCALSRQTHNLFPLRVVSGLSFILLFVIGPWTTYLHGLELAIILVLIANVVLIAIATWIIYDARSTINLDVKSVAAQFVELLLCPGYTPNICRRVSMRIEHPDVDGVLLFVRRGVRHKVDDLLGVVGEILQEKIAELEGRDRETANLQRYALRLGL